MNVTKLRKAPSKVLNGFSRVRGLIIRRKRLSFAMAALLLTPLALTGSGSAFLLNAMLLGGAALLAWLLMRSLRARRRKR